MAIKIWTAHDIGLGKLVLLPVKREGQTAIHLERRYQFIDENGTVLDEITGGRVLMDVLFTDLPQVIQDALAVIDNWTHQQALEQEGME